MRLSDLQPGDTGVIIKILGHGAFRKRVMEMGFVKGRVVRVLLNAPLQDPIKYSIMGYEVSLRRAEANLIEIVSDSEVKNEEDLHLVNTESNPEANLEPCDCPIEKNDSKDSDRSKVINVALLGNPNCGKTSMFNIVSGAHEHVGNYAGVTVGAKEGSLKYKGYKINIVDLPGTYSLSAYSPEEEYVLRYLKTETPDVIVNVVVASNLERNLYLTTELIDMNRSMVIALNMFDELKKNNIKLDYKHLGKMMGVPIVPTVASSGQGVNDLLDTIIDIYEMKQPDIRHIHVKLHSEVETAVSLLNDDMKHYPEVSSMFSPRYLAIKFLEKDPEVERMLSTAERYPQWVKLRESETKRIEDILHEDVASIVASEKYGFIKGALAETMVEDEKKESRTTKIIDAFVTNKLFGFPIFLLIMWLMFWATFQIGSYPMSWIESIVGWISDIVSTYMPEGPFKDLLVDGIIGGVGSVIVFLPNILILYLFISFMEDSGYMSRVAFIMDKVMHKIGLHGKSFIPLVMGFGCNVPSIISTRIIESKSSRLITTLLIPFMSCSARIPIYVVLVGCFFPNNGGLVFVSLYLIGIIIAILTAKLLRKVWFKTDETPFVMELPPYRMPTAKATMRGMWSKAKQYLHKMGGIILVASAIIWALSYFPRYEISEVPTEYKANAISEMMAFDAEQVNSLTEEEIDDMVVNEYQQENSILGRIGKTVEPIMSPLMMDWKATVALLAGLPAKEVVVSTMGVLYTGNGDDDAILSKKLVAPSPITGKTPFTPLSAYAFMVFVLIYFPCIATLVAVVKETHSWKYGMFSLLYNTLIAWIIAFAIVRIGSLFV
jgi:ferrous iron transport protein B